MVNESFTFARIPTLHFGAGKLSELTKTIKACRPDISEFHSGKSSDSLNVLLVTGSKSLQASGHLERIQSDLKDAGIRYQSMIIDAEPSTPFIDATCANFKDAGFQIVVGIGGGSVIDGAKAISAMLLHSNSVLDHLEDVGRNIPHSGRKIPYVAVPTTSGTGGEMTKNAVLSRVGITGYKKSLRHENLIPNAVIIDPELMLTCPPNITAACGMDAFTQLLEPYLSPIASPLTDAMALSGLEKIRDCLIPACTDRGQDLSIRAGMAYASMLSGVALANAGLGIVHGLASPIGGFFPIPHGVVCGTLVASATESNIQALRKRKNESQSLAKFAKIGVLFGGSAQKSEAYNCDFLVAQLKAWTETLQLPRLGDYGISEIDFARIAENTSNRHNPVQLDREEIYTLLARRL